MTTPPPPSRMITSSVAKRGALAHDGMLRRASVYATAVCRSLGGRDLRTATQSGRTRRGKTSSSLSSSSSASSSQHLAAMCNVQRVTRRNAVGTSRVKTTSTLHHRDPPTTTPQFGTPMAACCHRADLRICSRDLATSPRRSGPRVKTTLPAFTTSSAGTFCVPPRRRYRRRDAELRTSEVSRPRRPDEPPPLGSGWSRFYLFFAASSRAAVVIELTTQQVALLQGRLVTTCHTFRGSKNKTSSTSEGTGHQPQDRIMAQSRRSGGRPDVESSVALRSSNCVVV